MNNNIYNDTNVMSAEELKKIQEESDKKVLEKLYAKYKPLDKFLKDFDARWDLLPLNIVHDIYFYPSVPNYTRSDKNIMLNLGYCLSNIDKDADGVQKMLSYICCVYINKHFCSRYEAIELLARYCGKLQALEFYDAKTFSEIYPRAGFASGSFSYYISNALKTYYEAESYNNSLDYEVEFLFYLISAMYYIDTEIKKED